MFRWYQRATICYAYLCDVRIGEDPRKPESGFSKSRWFQRGWTLQELIAPRVIQFYDAEWNHLGSKRDLAVALTTITRIPRMLLLGIIPLSNASVAQRMSWAARRFTKRQEDMAYCLLGIFGITMPMVYGEGDRAFLRLQEEIMKHIDDDSILAWTFREDESINRSSRMSLGGALALSPSYFANSNHIVPSGSRSDSLRPLQTSGGSVVTQRCLYRDTSGQCFVVLQCQHEDNQGQPVGIPVQAGPGGFGNYVRFHERPSVLLPKDIPQGSTEEIRVSINGPKGNDKPGSIFYIDNSLEKDLGLLHVIPRRSWDQQKDVLILNDEMRLLLIRFRYKHYASDDFILVLELISRASKVRVRHHLMTCDREIDSPEIKKNFTIIGPRDLNKHSASNGALGLKTTVSRETIGTQDMFVVTLLEAKGSVNTYNVTNLLHRLRREREIVIAEAQEEKQHEPSKAQAKLTDLIERLRARREQQNYGRQGRRRS